MFESGKEYSRAELLDFIGSKQNQSGIIWGNKQPNCVIITSGGRHSKLAGYGDIRNPDGTWLYKGQGAKGNQNPNSFANSLLTKGKRAVLLFSTREPKAEEVRKRGSYKKLYNFEGIFHVVSWDYQIPTQGNRAGDKLIEYFLVPAQNIFSNYPTDDYTTDKYKTTKEPLNIYELRKKIGSQDTTPTTNRSSLTLYRERSSDVKQYALLRANGVCECCLSPAPFLNIRNTPFLEVHHIHSLSDDGPDQPENVAAVCPNCHREAHFGIKKESIREKLLLAIRKKESQLFS